MAESARGAFEARIAEGLRQMGVPVDERGLRLLAEHLRLVAEANRSLNLTAIEGPEDLVTRHVLDAAAVFPDVAQAPPGPLADIGSGAGFPGVPLAILTGRPAVLIESVRKKSAFLRSAVSDLGLQAEVASARAEEVAAERPRAFAVVTARAVAELPALVELAAPLLQPRGLFIALKGKPREAEVCRGDVAAVAVGLRRLRSRELRIPGLAARRSVHVYERVTESPRALPRPPGRAQKRPLA